MQELSQPSQAHRQLCFILSLPQLASPPPVDAGVSDSFVHVHLPKAWYPNTLYTPEAILEMIQCSGKQGSKPDILNEDLMFSRGGHRDS